MRKTHLLLIFACFISIVAKAQKEIEIVNDFGNYLSEFLSTSNQRIREQMYSLAPDADNAERSKCMHCLVDNGMSKILSADETDGFNGDCQIETYLNKLTLDKHNLRFTHGRPELLKDYKEPIAYYDKNEATRYFVKMDFSFKGDINYSGTDIFFVQGGKIVMIVDAESSIAKAISLYSSRHYEEAFRVFRELAYKSPNNYEAQYYTAVMEVKKQGCGFLDAVVRDTEAAWWITRGAVANLLAWSWDKERLSKLYIRFSVDEKKLPYHHLKKELFMAFLFTKKIVSESRLPFIGKNKLYGFMNEEGKVVVSPQYNRVLPYDSCGLAPVTKDGKVGYIDKGGEIIVPIEYDEGMVQWKNAKTFVIKKGRLLIIDKEGNILKQLGTGYDIISGVFFENMAFVHNKLSDKWYVHDLDGNIMSVENESFSIDFYKLCFFRNDNNGKRIKEDPIRW
jgi:hypothetical protein